MTLPGLLASCTRQDGDNQKILSLSYVSYPLLKSHPGIALYVSIEKKTEGVKEPQEDYLECTYDMIFIGYHNMYI